MAPFTLREMLGLCRSHVIDRRAVLRAFGAEDARGPADDYLRWVRSVAEARWAKADDPELPWWTQANHVDEIADADRHRDATTFDGLWLAEERAELDDIDAATSRRR